MSTSKLLLHTLLSLVVCLTSQHHASVSQGWICSDNCMCYHTEAADQACCLSHSILTLGWPVPALTLKHQVPGRVATTVPISDWYDSTWRKINGKSRHQAWVFHCGGRPPTTGPPRPSHTRQVGRTMDCQLAGQTRKVTQIHILLTWVKKWGQDRSQDKIITFLPLFTSTIWVTTSSKWYSHLLQEKKISKNIAVLTESYQTAWIKDVLQLWKQVNKSTHILQTLLPLKKICASAHCSIQELFCSQSVRSPSTYWFDSLAFKCKHT